MTDAAYACQGSQLTTMSPSASSKPKHRKGRASSRSLPNPQECPGGTAVSNMVHVLVSSAETARTTRQCLGFVLFFVATDLILSRHCGVASPT